jgi:endonuclease YncB( thermonuclease family)
MTNIVRFRRRRAPGSRSGQRIYRRQPGRRRSLVVEWATVILLFGALFLVTSRYDRIAQRTLGGVVRIADGDSLTLDGRKIRLKGIDAPEFNQTCQRGGGTYLCGRQARDHLAALARGGAVTCVSTEIDKYGRSLGYCHAGSTALNPAMVRAGWAVAYGDYYSEENAARAQKRGIWGGPFQTPKDWRAGNGGVVEDSHDLRYMLVNWIAQILGLRNMEEDG